MQDSSTWHHPKSTGDPTKQEVFVCVREGVQSVSVGEFWARCLRRPEPQFCFPLSTAAPPAGGTESAL